MPCCSTCGARWRRRGTRPRSSSSGGGGNDRTALELIDRCEAIAAHVTATGGLGDDEVASRLAGARALLTPSFVEGFGLPIVEAHLLGVPVIASDIAPHREIGGHSTTYLPPLDGRGWKDAIRAYAANPALAAQKAGAIVAPSGWDRVFDIVTERLLRLARDRR